MNAFTPAFIGDYVQCVATAILKLVEQYKLDTEPPIDDLVNRKTNKQLIKPGYKTHDIRIQPILSHTSEIANFVDDDYFNVVNAHKKHQRTGMNKLN